MLKIEINTAIAAWPPDLLIWHYYFTYCKISTVSSTTSYRISVLLSNQHTILYARQAFLFVGDSNLGPCLASLSSIYLLSVLMVIITYECKKPEGESNLSFLAMEHTSRLWVFLARLPSQIFGAPVGLAPQSILAARGGCIVISYSLQLQLNNPHLQTKAFFRAFSSHVWYCQPQK